MSGMFGSFFGGLLFIGLVVLAILLFLAPLFIYQIKHLLKKQIEETIEVRLAVRYLANTIEKLAAQKHTN